MAKNLPNPFEKLVMDVMTQLNRPLRRKEIVDHVASMVGIKSSRMEDAIDEVLGAGIRCGIFDFRDRTYTLVGAGHRVPIPMQLPARKRMRSRSIRRDSEGNGHNVTSTITSQNTTELPDTSVRDRSQCGNETKRNGLNDIGKLMAEIRGQSSSLNCIGVAQCDCESDPYHNKQESRVEINTETVGRRERVRRAVQNTNGTLPANSQSIERPVRNKSRRKHY